MKVSSKWVKRSVRVALSSLALAGCDGDGAVLEAYTRDSQPTSEGDGVADPGDNPSDPDPLGEAGDGSDSDATSDPEGNEDGPPGSSEPTVPGGSSSPDMANGPGGSDGGPPPMSGPSAPAPSPVFSEDVVQHYALRLDPVVWQRLQDYAYEEEYVEADLEVGGQQFPRVGLRFKGSLGTLYSCFSAEGERICAKLSMKVKFDEYLPDQRFFGLKRLNFNSMVRDTSLLRERLAYRIFREMGLPTPRAVHARITVNGEDQGLFTLVEAVDGRFTDDRFPDGGDGNLYKDQWPTTADAAVLDERLETGPDSIDHGVMLRFRAELAAAAPAELPAVVARYMDVDQVLAHLAVARAINDWDGVLTFLCEPNGLCENHNYYLYQDENQPRFTLIPWDVDRVFEGSPLTPMPDVFGPTPDCNVTYSDPDGVLIAPGCEPLIRGAVNAGPERVAAQVDRLLQGPFAPGVIEGWLDTWQAQIEPEVMTDTRGPGLDEFRRAVLDLRENVVTQRDRAGL